jgi:hypothetical protein
MRFLFFFLILSISFLNPLFAQEKIAETTVEEYNFLTKGYKIQLEAGLDMKRGYSLVNNSSTDDGKYSFEYSVLKRNATNEYVAILVVAKSKTWNNTYFICIPFENYELYNLYLQSISSWDYPMSKAYINSLSSKLGMIYNYILNNTKNLKL